MNFFEVEVKDGRIVSEDGLAIAIPEGQAKCLKLLVTRGKKSHFWYSSRRHF